jgi:hypothetical protein
MVLGYLLKPKIKSFNASIAQILRVRALMVKAVALDYQ